MRDAGRARRGQWGIVQKQTGADRLSLGGALAANVHGRGLTLRADHRTTSSRSRWSTPTARSRTLQPRARTRSSSGSSSAATGCSASSPPCRCGWPPRRKVERVVEVRRRRRPACRRSSARIADGFLYGDFQFAIDDRVDDFLRGGVFSCYRPWPDDDADPAGPAGAARARTWQALVDLAHVDKRRGVRRSIPPTTSRPTARSTGPTRISSRDYLDDYHAALDRRARRGAPATEIITELYVPRARAGGVSWRDAAARLPRARHRRHLRHDPPDRARRRKRSCAWAREPWACIIFNLHTEHTLAGWRRSAHAFRAPDRRGDPSTAAAIS